MSTYRIVREPEQMALAKVICEHMGLPTEGLRSLAVNLSYDKSPVLQVEYLVREIVDANTPTT